MYLHKEDRELFRDIIVTVSEKSGIEESIVEKDYYVTLILKELALRNPEVVFKGGTSLSKAYQIINRFSEDIDITFGEHIGEARRKKLKYGVLKPISETLGMPIDNWNKIESDKDYNHYDFSYDTVTSVGNDILRPYVKLETALMSYSYPTEKCKIESIIYNYLNETDSDIIDEFELYDIYKLSPYISINDEFRLLVMNVRRHRANMDIKIAPSAREDVDILRMVEEMVCADFYNKDYENSTIKLIRDDIKYETVIKYYSEIMHRLF